MNPGAFTHDDDGNDIVTLSPVYYGQTAIRGRVNIGEHAVELTLDANGGLYIQSHAKGHEGQVLASVQVPRLAATLVRLRAASHDRADPLKTFVADMTALGFGADEDISGADTVDAVNRHFDNLRVLADPYAEVEEHAQ